MSDEKCFEKAFRFDFVMIHVGMYTKCSEMFRFEKCLNFDEKCVVWKVFDLSKQLKVLLPTQNGRFCVVFVSF